MKIYLVDEDNGEQYGDNIHYVTNAFKSYRSASQYLLDEGYKPHPYESIDNGDWKINFYFEDDWGYADIIEMELQD